MSVEKQVIRFPKSIVPLGTICKLYTVPKGIGEFEAYINFSTDIQSLTGLENISFYGIFSTDMQSQRD